MSAIMLASPPELPIDAEERGPQKDLLKPQLLLRAAGPLRTEN